MAALMEKYRTETSPELMKEFGHKNSLSVAKITKIVISMRINSSEDKKEALEEAGKVLSTITGQKPAPRKAKKSVSGFRLREGDIVGCMVTLRNKRMYEFLERLVNVAIPRIRDFRGLNPDSFDSRGNYNMGIEECLIFPELGPDDVKNSRGMNITIVTSSKTDEEAARLLRLLGMPFQDQGGRS